MVAVEPQPDLLAVIRLLYGADPDVIIEPCAVGRSPGRTRLHVSTASPTVSTASRSWMGEVRRAASFSEVRWDREIEVPVRTLDELIAAHGEPAFVKIDVEGFEEEVLAGLSRPVRALSVEYIPAALDRTLACVGRLERLGDYRYTYSPLEDFRPATPGWLDAAGIAAALSRLSADDPPGDVYAIRRDAAGR